MKFFPLAFLPLWLFAGAPLPAAAQALTGAAAPAWVEWDRSTDHVVSAPGDAGAAYPRARQLSNGEILLAYHHGDGLGNFGSRVTLRRSRDGGATWYRTQEIDGAREHGFWGFCNPDFIELGGGRMMLVTAARGKPDVRPEDAFSSEGRHSGLRVRFSANYGLTWGPPRLIAAGRGRVWEPSIVRLPGGELQIFFANESPVLMLEGSTQCIEAMRSLDGGATWTDPVIVSENANCRNGMPTALALDNGHVVCAQEVVGARGSPYLADTVGGRSTGSYRLAQDRYDFGAAPFLARGPDGGTLLAFHSQLLQGAGFKRLHMAWMFSQIFVQRGDGEAGAFGPASCPWPVPEQRSGMFFPSLMLLDGGRSVVALASHITVSPTNRVSTVVRWVKGRLLSVGTGGDGAAVLGRAGPGARANPPVSAAAGAAPRIPLGGGRYQYGPPMPEDEARD